MKATVEIVKFDVNDVITTSQGGGAPITPCPID